MGNLSINFIFQKYYPLVSIQGGVDFNNDGFIEVAKDETVDDINGDGEYDEWEFFDFYCRNQPRLNLDLITEVISQKKPLQRDWLKPSSYGWYQEAEFAKLGKMGTEEALQKLYKALDKIRLVFLSKDYYNSAKVRDIAVGITKFGWEKVQGKLNEMLQSNNKTMQLGAVIAFGELKNFSVVSGLIKLYQTDPDNEIKDAIFESLGKIADPGSMSFLLEEAGSALLVESGNEIIEAIVEMGKVAIPELVKALQSEKGEIRCVAAEALSYLEAKEAVPSIMAALEKESEHKVIEKMLAALGRQQDSRAIDLIFRFLSTSTSHRNRINAAYALRNLQNEKAISLVIQAFDKQEGFNSKSIFIRTSFMYAIGFSRMYSILPFILRAFKDPLWEIREIAARALIDLCGKEEALFLQRILEAAAVEENPLVRRTAIYAMGRIKNPQFLSYLKVALRDDFLYVRRETVKALQNYKSRKAEKILKAFTKTMADAPSIRRLVDSAFAKREKKEFTQLRKAERAWSRESEDEIKQLLLANKNKKKIFLELINLAEDDEKGIINLLYAEEFKDQASVRQRLAEVMGEVVLKRSRKAEEIESNCYERNFECDYEDLLGFAEQEQVPEVKYALIEAVNACLEAYEVMACGE